MSPFSLKESKIDMLDSAADLKKKLKRVCIFLSKKRVMFFLFCIESTNILSLCEENAITLYLVDVVKPYYMWQITMMMCSN